MFVSARWCVCVCAWVCVFKCALVHVPMCVCVPVCACVKSVRASVIQSGSLIVAEALFVLSVPSLLYHPLLQSSVLLHAPPCLSDRHTDGPRTTKDFLFLHLLFSVACPTLVLFYHPPSPASLCEALQNVSIFPPPHTRHCNCCSINREGTQGNNDLAAQIRSSMTSCPRLTASLRSCYEYECPAIPVRNPTAIYTSLLLRCSGIHSEFPRLREIL